MVPLSQISTGRFSPPTISSVPDKHTVRRLLAAPGSHLDALAASTQPEFSELDSIKGPSYDEKLSGIDNGARGRQAIAGYKA
jgi:hypothetical protein